MALPPVRPQIRNRFSAGTSADVPAKEETVMDIIQRGAILAERNVPSFIPGIRASTVLVSDRVPSIAAIDQYWRTYWHPEGVKWFVRAAQAVSAAHKCTACGATSHSKYAYVAGLWIHEIGHPTFDHHARFEAGMYPNKDDWNVVTDMEMNDDIPVMGQQAQKFYDDQLKADPGASRCPAMCIPKHAYMNAEEHKLVMTVGEKQFTKMTGKTIWQLLHPVGTHTPDMVQVPFAVFPDNLPGGQVLPNGLIAENYFELMPKKQGKSKGAGASGGPGTDTGDDDGAGDGSGAGGLPGLNDHGSGVDGEERVWEEGKPGDGSEGNAFGIDASEAQAIRRDIATRIKDPSDSRGTTPAGWQVWADTQLQPPKVRWEDRFAAMVRQGIHRVRGDKQNTFRRLSRTSIVQDCKVIKPSTYSVIPTVVIVVDTSGSMGAGSRSRLERALSEAEAITKSQKCLSLFIDCDGDVYGKAQEVKTLIKAKIHGGGGTDMRRGVLAAKKTKPKADIIILLTDGDTPWPTAADLVGVKIITGICNERDNMASVPQWMNPIWVDTNGKK